MKNRAALLIILVLLLSNALLLYLYFNKDNRGYRKDRMMDRFTKEVGFSKEQAARFEALRKQQRTVMEPLMDSLRLVKKEYVAGFADQKNKELSKDLYMTKVAALMFRMDDSLYSQLSEARKICTPEQYAAYDSIVKKMLMRIPMDKKPAPKN